MGTIVFLVIAFLFGIYAFRKNSGCLLTIFVVVFFFGGFGALNSGGIHPALSFLLIASVSVGSYFSAAKLEEYSSPKDSEKHYEIDLTDSSIKSLLFNAIDVIKEIDSVYSMLDAYTDCTKPQIYIRAVWSDTDKYSQKESINLKLSFRMKADPIKILKELTYRNIELLGNEYDRFCDFFYKYDKYKSFQSSPEDGVSFTIPVSGQITVPKGTDARKEIPKAVVTLWETILDDNTDGHIRVIL